MLAAAATVIAAVIAGVFTLIPTHSSGGSQPAGGGATVLAPAPPVSILSGTCPFGNRCALLTGVADGGAKIENINKGSSNPQGYAAGLNNPGDSETLKLTNVPRKPGYSLIVRYANSLANDGFAAKRKLGVVINGVLDRQRLVFLETLTWGDWAQVAMKVQLRPGSDQLSLACVDNDAHHDACHINIDWIQVVAVDQ
jgi:hypothetical protein